MFELARNYKDAGMAAYSRLQEKEFLREQAGYGAAKHQRFVGTGYFDSVQQVITSGTASTMALAGSTETAQFSGAGASDPIVELSQRRTEAASSEEFDAPLTESISSSWEESDELMPSGD